MKFSYPSSSIPIWIDERLNEEEMNFLWDACSGPEHKEDFSHTLAGNISKSERLEDKDNWFYETVLKKLTEKMFYRNCNNYYEKYIEKEESPPEFILSPLWVNYQKQHEFNPLHDHSGQYSFVVFMKIPTHWEEQHALPISANSRSPLASDFAFVWSEKNSQNCAIVHFSLSPEDEGRILFFPATLQHLVYPFYNCDKERITISGNIMRKQHGWELGDKLNEPIIQEIPAGEYEEKKKLLEILENSVKITKKELKWMKKANNI